MNVHHGFYAQVHEEHRRSALDAHYEGAIARPRAQTIKPPRSMNQAKALLESNILDVYFECVFSYSVVDDTLATRGRTQQPLT